MNSIILDIAGYILRMTLDRDEDITHPVNTGIYNNINNNTNYNICNNISFNINDRLRGFLIPAIPPGRNEDLVIKVHPGDHMPEKYQEVFSASLPEGTDIAGGKGIPEFWSVLKTEDETFLKILFPESDKKALLRFSLSVPLWDLWTGHNEGAVDPLEYPLDGLILYYLSAMNADIMMHASGVNIDGKGLIFSGVSGKGKSTLARLFREQGAGVIHDDRLILRWTPSGYMMHNTPVYPGERPIASKIDQIYLIEHGTDNRIEKVGGVNSISNVMANCIQHNWDRGIIIRQLFSVERLCKKVPVHRLSFVPDSNIVNFLLKNE